MTTRITKQVFLALLISILLLTSGCLGKALQEQNKNILDTKPKATGKYELTKVDLFAEKDWKGTDVAIFGVTLGDSKEAVIEKIGLPDNQITYPGSNSTNFEYSKQLTTPRVGLLIHFDDNEVTRMTVKIPFNRFLVGSTKIKEQTKSNMFALLGRPSRLKLLSFFTQYEFHEKGIEIFMDGKELNGFSFVYPKPEVKHIEVVTDKTTGKKIDISEMDLDLN